jgi:hypothetical protein
MIIIPIPLSTGIGGGAGNHPPIPDGAVKDLKAGDWFVTITHDGQFMYSWWTRIYQMEHDGVAPLWFEDKATAMPSMTRWGAKRKIRKLIKIWTQPARIEVYRA